ncbi:MAG: hypothetical protein JNM66_19140 [Bryobacterales bacterium]|nr:hypothetical protein [Bryobacterales bacterium]
MWIDELIPGDSDGAADSKRRMRRSYVRLLRTIDVKNRYSYRSDEEVSAHNKALQQHLNESATKIFRYCYESVLKSNPTIGDSDEEFKKYIRTLHTVIEREMNRLFGEYRAEGMWDWNLNPDEPLPEPPPWGFMCLLPYWGSTMEEEAWTRFLDHVAGEALTKKAVAPTRAEVIKPILEARGWSVLDWALASNVDFHTANDFLNGATKRAYRSTRVKLATGLGIKVAELPL